MYNQMFSIPVPDVGVIAVRAHYDGHVFTVEALVGEESIHWEVPLGSLQDLMALPDAFVKLVEQLEL